jgi:hypothetical protein
VNNRVICADHPEIYQALLARAAMVENNRMRGGKAKRGPAGPQPNERVLGALTKTPLELPVIAAAAHVSEKTCRKWLAVFEATGAVVRHRRTRSNGFGIVHLWCLP